MNRIPSKTLFSGLAIAFALTLLPMTMGCGGGDGTTVIQPGEDYQLTAQEEINKQKAIEARESGTN